MAAPTHPCRWYQFSLRTLFIGITVSTVVLGGRVEYLRRYAMLHEGEANRLARKISDETGLSHDWLWQMADLFDWRDGSGGSMVASIGGSGDPVRIEFNDDFTNFDHHRVLAAKFRRAVYCPWIVTDERQCFSLCKGFYTPRIIIQKEDEAKLGLATEP